MQLIWDDIEEAFCRETEALFACEMERFSSERGKLLFDSLEVIRVPRDFNGACETYLAAADAHELVHQPGSPEHRVAMVVPNSKTGSLSQVMVLTLSSAVDLRCDLGTSARGRTPDLGALHTFHHELAHVDDEERRWRLFGRRDFPEEKGLVMLKRCEANQVWAEFYATWVSAKTATRNALNEQIESFKKDLGEAGHKMPIAIKTYHNSKDNDLLFQEALRLHRGVFLSLAVLLGFEVEDALGSKSGIPSECRDTARVQDKMRDELSLLLASHQSWESRRALDRLGDVLLDGFHALGVDLIEEGDEFNCRPV